MRVKNIKRNNRTAFVIAENDMILYDAYEGKDLISRNMVRPADKFWAEHTR